jgi:hypothetical protein
VELLRRFLLRGGMLFGMSAVASVVAGPWPLAFNPSPAISRFNMTKRLLIHIVAFVALVFAAVPAFAHHSWPVTMEKLVTVKGTVMAFAWENPHPMITLEVRTPDGKTETWQVGGPAINRMEANGWTRTTLKPGDVISGSGYQFSDGQKILRLERITMADGKEFRLYAR